MMKVPILECFNDEGIINRQSYMDKCSKEFIDAIDLIKKHNIDTCLFLFIKDKNFHDEIKKKCKLFYIFTSASNENWAYIYDNKFVLAQSPLGGPASAAFMEELGFLGIKNFFACGSAGQVNSNFDSSKLVLVEKSIRDEGISYHYLKKSVYVDTNKELTNFLAHYLEENNIKYERAVSWCNDAFYRETPKAIAKRVKQGAVSVEMESAGWSAVAKFRGYRFAQLLYFSDAVKQEGWQHAPNKSELKIFIIKLMIDCVSKFCCDNEVIL